MNDWWNNEVGDKVLTRAEAITELRGSIAYKDHEDMWMMLKSRKLPVWIAEIVAIAYERKSLSLFIQSLERVAVGGNWHEAIVLARAQ